MTGFPHPGRGRCRRSLAFLPAPAGEPGADVRMAAGHTFFRPAVNAGFAENAGREAQFRGVGPSPGEMGKGDPGAATGAIRTEWVVRPGRAAGVTIRGKMG